MGKGLQHKRFRRLGVSLTALAVLYLSIAVHLLHPLFHVQEGDCAHARSCTHAQAQAAQWLPLQGHSSSTCPLYDYCRSLSSIDLPLFPLLLRVDFIEEEICFSPTAPRPVFPYSSCLPRAPPVCG